MRTDSRRQLTVLGAAVLLLAAITGATYLLVPLSQFATPGQPIPASVEATPRWVLAGENALFVLVIYGLLALAGYWFGRKLGLPPTYREGAGWRTWILWPMLVGLGIGVVLVIVDQILARLGSGQGFAHPAFPLSIFASATAGIGEEILFRGLVMGLWAFLINLVLRGSRRQSTALWIGNVIAALAFSASHLPSGMLLLNLTNPAQIPVPMLLELLLLNSFIGLVAGRQYMRDGLVAAMGIHFWADVLWHVVFPLTGLGV